MHKHIKEFSRQAKNYDSHTVVQKRVAAYLFSKISTMPQKILDLGCGTGEVSRQISWQYSKLVAVDDARGMCDIHPIAKNITVLNENFESDVFKEYVRVSGRFDMVVSSSVLQWSQDLENTLAFIANSSHDIALSIFTDNTFKDIYNTTKLKTHLPNANYLIELLKKYFVFTCEIKNYRLPFEDNLSKFRYIKKSGVSGGVKRLSVTEMKNLIKNYPHQYLEFEVLFVWGKSLQNTALH